MFIRKRKVLKMIEDLIEDAEYWKVRWKDDPERVAAFQAEGDALVRLDWWVRGHKPSFLMKRSDRP